MNDPFVIGISGSIGSGKSLVRHLLALRGVLPVDADELIHFLLMEGKTGYHEVVHAFGREILEDNGKLDREKLGNLVFRDPRQLQKLEAILHALVHQIMLDMLAISPSSLIVVEAIKLYTSQLLQLCDSRWFVTATLDSQLSRLKKTRGMDVDAAMQRLHQQYFPEDAQIDYFIENSGNIEETWEQVNGIWYEMCSENSKFRATLDRSAKKVPRVMLDYPAMQLAERHALQPLMEWAASDSLQDPVNWEEVIFNKRYFVNRIPSSPSAFLLWKFDHFNAIVSMDAAELDESSILSALEEIEMIACSWLGNNMILNIRNGSGSLEEKLCIAGYHECSTDSWNRHPFLEFVPVKGGTMEIPWVKLFADGIGRFIP